MAEVLSFEMPREDLGKMDRRALEEYLERLRALISELDAREPRNMNSEAYEQWGEEHEALEDLVDEVLDRCRCEYTLSCRDRWFRFTCAVPTRKL